MSARDLFDLVRDSAIPDMEAFRPVLAVLADHGAVRLSPGEAGNRGRPAELWQVHPDLLLRDLRDNS